MDSFGYVSWHDRAAQNAAVHVVYHPRGDKDQIKCTDVKFVDRWDFRGNRNKTDFVQEYPYSDQNHEMCGKESI